MSNKTWWQRVYSFFGFWTYKSVEPSGDYRAVYWCCLPSPFPWFRKFDIFKYKL